MTELQSTEPYCSPTIGERKREHKIGRWPSRRSGKTSIEVRGGEHIARRLESHGVRENDVERALLLVHWMVGRVALSGREGVDGKWGWISMTKEFLNSVIGDEARRYLPRVMCEIGVFDLKPWKNRGPNSSPKRYRLSECFAGWESGLQFVSENLLQRLAAWTEKARNSSINAHEVHRRLWEDLQHLDLDDNYEESLPDFGGYQWLKELAWRRSIDQIINKNHLFSHSPPCGRIYSVFSGTPSALRRHATLDGDPAVCIDVQCSQPFLHSTLLSHGAEKERYMESVLSSRFYEDLAEAAGNHSGKSIHRKQLKADIFKEVFYGPVKSAENAPIWGIFSELYPDLADAIEYRKQYNYKRLAVDMQNLEAKIVIHGAAAALYEQFPDIRILTVHDALYVTENFKQQAIEALQSAFINETGYSPNFHIEKGLAKTDRAS